MNRIRLTAKHKYKPASSYFTVVAAILLLAAAMPARSLNFSTFTIDSSGDTGLFASLAIDQNGTLHAAYMDSSNSYCFYSSKTVAGDWNLPEDELIDGCIGHTSIAVGVDGNIHLSFYASPPPCDDGLCYAKSDDGVTWTIESIDKETEAYYTSIALDGAGNPHIVYTGLAFELKYAKFDSINVTWSTRTVDGSANLVPDVGGDEELARQVSVGLDGAGNPHIAYYDVNSNGGELKYISFDGSTWSPSETVDNTGTPLFGVSLALDGFGMPHISYTDFENWELRFASKTVVSFSASIAVPAGPPNPWFGSSLALDGNAHPNIAFAEEDAADTLYAWHDGDSWNTQTVDDSGNIGAFHASLALDASGDVHFVYGDPFAGDSDFVYASATAAGFAPPMGGNNRSKVQAPMNFHADTIGSTDITWAWTQNSSNELGFRLYGAFSSTGPFTLIKGINTIGPDVTFYNETGLTSGATYFRYIAAVNAGGVVTSSGALVVTAASQAVEETVDPGAGKTIILDTPAGEAKIRIPAQTFSESVVVAVEVTGSFPGDTPRLQGTGVGINITLNPSIQPAKDVTISIPYQNTDVVGLDESKLVLARYDTAHSAWVPLFSTRDTVNNKVTAKTDHLSIFQIMQAALADTLSEVTIGPNPFRTSRNPGQDMTFRNLPAGARVRIYTYLGELLYDTNEDGGMATWDGRNKSGKQVASGVYIAFIEGAGGKKTFKVALER